jgi:hypothetical protein
MINVFLSISLDRGKMEVDRENYTTTTTTTFLRIRV